MTSTSELIPEMFELRYLPDNTIAPFAMFHLVHSLDVPATYIKSFTACGPNYVQTITSRYLTCLFVFCLLVCVSAQAPVLMWETAESWISSCRLFLCAVSGALWVHWVSLWLTSPLTWTIWCGPSGQNITHNDLCHCDCCGFFILIFSTVLLI